MLPLWITAILFMQGGYFPIESAHRVGPHGLAGWTVSQRFEADQDPRPIRLVIARHGHTLRIIPGDPFVWAWRFQADGRYVAYETGPLHFGLICNLVEVNTGKKISDYDCYRPGPDAPAWVKELEGYVR